MVLVQGKRLIGRMWQLYQVHANIRGIHLNAYEGVHYRFFAVYFAAAFFTARFFLGGGAPFGKTKTRLPSNAMTICEIFCMPASRNSAA